MSLEDLVNTGIGLLGSLIPLHSNAIAFSLGGIDFKGFEIPEKLPLGGDQAHSVHDFPGGTRTVQAYGWHRRPLMWSGTLYEDTAFTRSAALEAIAQAGKPVDFVYGGLQLRVLVVRFHPDVIHQYEVHYEIEMVVVDQVQAQTAPAPVDSNSAILFAMQAALQWVQALLDGIGALISALTSSTPAGNTGIVTNGVQITALTPVIPINPATPGVTVNLAALLAQFNQWSVDMTVCYPWDNLTSDTLSRLVASSNALAVGVDAVAQCYRVAATTADDMTRLLAAEECLASVRLASQKLSAIMADSDALQVYVAGTTAYKLAAQYYGDPSLFQTIMAANGLTDPVITTPVNLTIPNIAVAGDLRALR